MRAHFAVLALGGLLFSATASAERVKDLNKHYLGLWLVPEVEVRWRAVLRSLAHERSRPNRRVP